MGLKMNVFPEEVFLGFSHLEGAGFVPLWQHFSEMWGFISEFHVAIIVFYASFNFSSTEVLVGEACRIKGEQAEIIPPACRFWKAI